jgi:hypothetical protein
MVWQLILSKKKKKWIEGSEVSLTYTSIDNHSLLPQTQLLKSITLKNNARAVPSITESFVAHLICKSPHSHVASIVVEGCVAFLLNRFCTFSSCPSLCMVI